MKLLLACSSPFGYEEGSKWFPMAEIPYNHVRELAQCIGKAQRQVEIQVLYGCYLPELNRALRNSEAEILHLVCHGSKGGKVYFEEPEKGVQEVGWSELLKGLLQGSKVRLLTLAACHGEALFAQAPLEELECGVVAVNRKKAVLEQDAFHFFENFYVYLFQGQALAEAFENALVKLGLDSSWPEERTPEYLKGLFRLLKDTGERFACPQGEPSFSGLVEEDSVYEPLPEEVLRGRLNFRAKRHFFPNALGREEPKSKFLLFLGAGGVGKSILARQVARRLHQEGRFPGGVFWCSLEGRQSYEAVLEALQGALGLEPGPEAEAALLGRLQGQGRALIVLDNLDQVAAQEDREEGRKILGLFKILTQNGALLLGTSQVKLPWQQVTSVSVEDFEDEELLNYVWKVFQEHFGEEVAESQGLLERLAKVLRARVGGHPLSLFLILSRLEEGLGPKEAVEELLASLEQFLKEELDELDLPERHLSLENCLDYSLQGLAEVEGRFLKRSALLPAGLPHSWRRWPPPLRGFLAEKREKETFERLKKRSFYYAEGPAHNRRAKLLTALRGLLRERARKEEPEAPEGLLERYAAWLEGLAPSPSAGGELARELENILGLLFEIAQEGVAFALLPRLYALLLKHQDFLPTTPRLAELHRLMVEIRRELAELNPEAFRADLAQSLGLLGLILEELAQKEAGCASLREALLLLHPFVERHPEAFGPLALGIKALFQHLGCLEEGGA